MDSECKKKIERFDRCGDDGKNLDTDFFQPASEMYLAYIFPMAPIPMRPIVGCSYSGASGVTFGRSIMGADSCSCRWSGGREKRGELPILGTWNLRL